MSAAPTYLEALIAARCDAAAAVARAEERRNVIDWLEAECHPKALEYANLIGRREHVK